MTPQIETGDRPAPPGSLAVLNAAAVVVAALYFGRELVEPMVLAVLLAFVLAPLVGLFQRARLGRTLSVFIAVIMAFCIIGGIGMVVGRQATTLAHSIPEYQATIEHKVKALHLGPAVSDGLQSSLHGVLGSAEQTAKAPPGGAHATQAVAAGPVSGLGNPSALVIAVAPTLLGPLATLGVVLIFVIFVLLFREDLRDRLVRLVGRQDLHRTILALNDAAHRLSRFFLFQVAINTGFGTFIGAGLAVAGLPNPVLWGILAAMMRFVPFIGTFIAAAPPLLLALAVMPGWSLAIVVLLLYGVSEMIMGQVIEPLLYGHSTGLSPIAVILAATFWAFLWGPVGLLLATPLTVCLVVIGKHVRVLAFLDVMLGDSPPLDAEETFYQRALEGNFRVLLAQARQAVARLTLAEYYDRVAISGLVLAQTDLSRDALAFDRLEAIHNQIDMLVAALGADRASLPHAPANDVSGTPQAWRQDGAVLCIPGRGQLDDLTAKMAVQVLQGVGFGARYETNLVLGAQSGGDGEAGCMAEVRLVCLSVLEQGSSSSAIRYLLRRIARQMPHAAVVVCLWRAAGDSAILATLRSQGSEEMIVLSLGELAALTKAICARRERVAQAVAAA